MNNTTLTTVLAMLLFGACGAELQPQDATSPAAKPADASAAQSAAKADLILDKVP
jgi:uncharacterized lipoprotein YajG